MIDHHFPVLHVVNPCNFLHHWTDLMISHLAALAGRSPLAPRPRGPDLEVFGTVEESEDLLCNLLDFPQFSPFWGQLQWDYPASSWWFSSVP
jgi:hypothetical protein